MLKRAIENLRSPSGTPPRLGRSHDSLRFQIAAPHKSLLGSYLSLPLAADPGEPGRVYWDEVIGVQVNDIEGAVIGTVIDCYRAGGAEVYILRTPDGGELDLPAVASIIVSFKPREGVIIADLTGSDLTPRAPKRVKQSRPANPVRTP